MRGPSPRPLVLSLLGALIAIVLGPILTAQGNKNSPLPFSPDVLEMICGDEGPPAQCQRFVNTEYVALLTGTARASWQPKALFGRITAAHAAGEDFKALFLARIFTELDPATAAGWTNRAALAEATGSLDEAKWAADPARAGKSFRPAFLPGAITRRPVTLPDWAALIALMSEDVERATGAPQMLYVPDDATGLLVTPTKPGGGGDPLPGWAEPKPVLFEDLLPNAVVATNLEAMKWRSLYATSRGSMLLGLATAVATAAGNVQSGRVAPFEAVNAADAARSITVVPSVFSEGRYTTLTWPTGSPQQRIDAPKSSGASHAIHLPMPIPWSAGSPWTLSVPVRAVGKMGEDGQAPSRWSRAATLKAGKEDIGWYFNLPGANQHMVGLNVKEIQASDQLQLVKVARFTQEFVPREGTFAERQKRGVTVLDEAFLAREKAEQEEMRTRFANRSASPPPPPPPSSQPPPFMRPAWGQSPTVTLIETLLTKADIQELAPGVAPLWPDLTGPAESYREQSIAVEFGVAHASDGFISFGNVSTAPQNDGSRFRAPLGLLLVDRDRMFTYRLTPTLWLTPGRKR